MRRFAVGGSTPATLNTEQTAAGRQDHLPRREELDSLNAAESAVGDDSSRVSCGCGNGTTERGSELNRVELNRVELNRQHDMAWHYGMRLYCVRSDDVCDLVNALLIW